MRLVAARRRRGSAMRRRPLPTFVILCVLSFASRVAHGNDVVVDDSSSADTSEILDAHERALEDVALARARRDAQEALSRVQDFASLAPSLEGLRARGLGAGDGSMGPKGRYPRAPDEEIEDEDERDRWIAAREALYALSALRRIGVIEDEDVAEGEKPWHVSALERSALMGDEWARTAFAYRLWKGFDGVEKDEERAVKIMKEVAMTGLGRGPSTYELKVPTTAEWLRDRERDAGWISESIANRARDQVAMEVDAAARGDNHAHAQLGYRALVGDQGVERNERAAYEHFLEAANRRGGGLPETHYNLGFMHMNGMGTEKNYTAAREQFLKSIALGRVASAYNGLGVLAYNGYMGEQNYTEALYYFEEAAKLEDPDGHFNLAQMYSMGHGVEMNATYGLEIMERASELGHWRAPYELGMAYDLALAVDRNVTKATSYFHVFIEERFDWAKERNDAIEAMIIHKNPWGALVRYALISALGSESASNNVVWLLHKTDAYMGDDRYELAARLLREIIYCHNSPEAQVDLAYLLSSRRAKPDHSDMIDRYDHIHPNASEYDIAAIGHYSAAAFDEEHPYPEALVNLGWKHLLGLGVSVNATRSFELFAKGVVASHDHHEAAPCVAATIISKAWLIAAATSKRMNFGTLGLPAAHFRPGSSYVNQSSGSSAALRVIRLIELSERYILIGLTLALASVLAYRVTLTYRVPL